jgi:hypothetical protein
MSSRGDLLFLGHWTDSPAVPMATDDEMSPCILKFVLFFEQDTFGHLVSNWKDIFPNGREIFVDIILGKKYERGTRIGGKFERKRNRE